MEHHKQNQQEHNTNTSRTSNMKYKTNPIANTEETYIASPNEKPQAKQFGKLYEKAIKHQAGHIKQTL